MNAPARLGWWEATLRMSGDQPVVAFGYVHSDVEYVFVLDTAANEEWALYHDDDIGTLVICGARKVDDDCFVLLDHQKAVNHARELRKRAAAYA